LVPQQVLFLGRDFPTTKATNDQQPYKIVIRDGTPQKVPTSYHGDLRIRLLALPNPKERGIEPPREGEILFVLDVTPEPRVRQLSILGDPLVQHAIDDRGQALKWTMEPRSDIAFEDTLAAFVARFPGRDVGFPAPPVPSCNSFVPLRLRAGALPQGFIKELTGRVTVKALTMLPEPFIVVEDVMNAIGKPATGPSGGVIEVQKFEKEGDDKFRIKIGYEPPSKLKPPDNYSASGGQGANAAGLVFRAAGVHSTNESVYYDGPTLPVLLDSKGRALTLEKIPERHGMVTDDGWIQTGLTMIYRAELGVGPPVRIVLVGDFAATATVPFRFENVPVK
jgi:hypothetical protein